MATEEKPRVTVDMSGMSESELQELGKGVADELKKRISSHSLPEPNTAIRAVIARGLFYSAVDLYCRLYPNIPKKDAEALLSKYK